MARLTAIGVTVSLLALLVSCGGKVLVDEPPSSSSTGAGGTSTGVGPSGVGPSAVTGGVTNGTGTSGVTAVASGAGGGAGFCEQACGTIAGCLANGSECVGSCSQANPNCASSFQPFLACVGASVDPETCALPRRCASSLSDWLECESALGEEGCFFGDAICGCKAGGIDTDLSYETQCQFGQGGASCQCLRNGALAGTCFDGFDTSCSVFTGCCATIFFVPGG